MARKTKEPEGIVDTIKTVVYALLIAGVFRTLLFQPFWIPSGSMKDTLLVGDYIVINKMAYGYSAVSCPFSLCPITGRILGSQPKRGDVVVFRHPSSNEDLIKRVIGLPGDTVQMKDGQLYINDTAVPAVAAGQGGDLQQLLAGQGRAGFRQQPMADRGRIGAGQDLTLDDSLGGGGAVAIGRGGL